jgi:hypothetical protein
MSLQSDQAYLERFVTWLEGRGVVLLYPAGETLADLITAYTVEES